MPFEKPALDPSMVGKLFLLFTIVPVVELYLLIKIGKLVGAPATIAFVIIMGIAGAALARAEGLRVLRAWQEALAAGRTPEDGVVSGALILLAGVLMIAPGVLTDVAGLLLLLPFVRRPVARYVSRRLERAVAAGTIQVVRSQPMSWPPRSEQHRPFPHGDVIDVEGESVPEPPGKLH